MRGRGWLIFFTSASMGVLRYALRPGMDSLSLFVGKEAAEDIDMATRVLKDTELKHGLKAAVASKST